jgi:hypothetical protein
MAHWPSSAGPAAHFALAVQCAMPLGSPLTQTLGFVDNCDVGYQGPNCSTHECGLEY